jgi:hypothetical protein
LLWEPAVVYRLDQGTPPPSTIYLDAYRSTELKESCGKYTL